MSTQVINLTIERVLANIEALERSIATLRDESPISEELTDYLAITLACCTMTKLHLSQRGIT